MIGLLMVALGVLGAFLPVMPSTIFFIVALYFFSQSSERLETWLLEHPQWGPQLKNWRAHRCIHRNAKIAAGTGMSLGLALLLLSPAPSLVKIFGTLFILGSALFVLSRPEFIEPKSSL